MRKILLLDTSVASDNKGDDIIMECVRKELQFLLNVQVQSHRHYNLLWIFLF